MPKSFDAAGLKLLRKVAELSQKLRGHALVAFADSKHVVQYYASSKLQELVAETATLEFLRQQLIEQYHEGLSVVSDFASVDSVHAQKQTA